MRARTRSGLEACAWLAADGEVDRVGDEAEMMRAVVQRFRERQVAALFERHRWPQDRLGEVAAACPRSRPSCPPHRRRNRRPRSCAWRTGAGTTTCGTTRGPSPAVLRGCSECGRRETPDRMTRESPVCPPPSIRARARSRGSPACPGRYCPSIACESGIGAISRAFRPERHLTLVTSAVDDRHLRYFVRRRHHIRPWRLRSGQLKKSVRDRRGVTRHRSHDRFGGADHRPARAQRRRQDDAGRDPRRAANSLVWFRGGARPRSRARARRVARAARRAAANHRLHERADRRRDAAPLRGVVSETVVSAVGG